MQFSSVSGVQARSCKYHLEEILWVRVMIKMSAVPMRNSQTTAKTVYLCMRCSSTGQQKCEDFGWCHRRDDFRVDSQLVRWALASASQSNPQKVAIALPAEDWCTQPWGSGADGALTKGFSDLTIVRMDPSKTKYAPYCPDIQHSSGYKHI